jgi:preprotein translocase subunit SecD
MIKTLYASFCIIVAGFATWFVGFYDKTPFKLGLDLVGGTALVFDANLSGIAKKDQNDAMSSAKNVIEKRVNAFGISEPVVTVESAPDQNGEKIQRIRVELPGISDVQAAANMIGQTPLLEFKTLDPTSDPKNPTFITTELTGKYLSRSRVTFPNSGAGAAQNAPAISLQFDSEGTKLFRDITTVNVGKPVAIFLDGNIISAPTVQQAIGTGEAIISGNFEIKEAKILVERLNSGALPVPLKLGSTQLIGPTLGLDAVHSGVRSGMVAFAAIALFLLVWYRMAGLVGVVSLFTYVVITLALMKKIPITLTASGIAGFIISLGIAVDANILVFERIKEELLLGNTITESIKQGFSRAWFSIRDANFATFSMAIIIFVFGTPLMKGFATTLGLGVIVSMLTSLSVSKSILVLFPNAKKDQTWYKNSFLSGINLTK